MSRIGIIGGSGLYEMEGLTNIKEQKLDTPFGAPSDVYITGVLEGRDVVFLPRHGKGHRILPTEINNRANIWGMKKLGVNWIISVSAVGSLRKDYKPQDIVIIDQFFDRTNQARKNTFFGDGIAVHIQFDKPICSSLAKILVEAGAGSGVTIHSGGIYVNMEGPAFSTLAESQTYRKWGMDVVGMTQMNEARLAREAEICYATIAMITDYDCWYGEEPGSTVSADLIVENLMHNVVTARYLIKNTVRLLPQQQVCECANALANSLITDKSLWPKETVKKLGPIVEKYYQHV